MLASVGLYGLISHEVELGRKDLGIRAAVGAPRSSIFSLVYRRAGAMLAIGLLAGVVATWTVRSMLASVVTLKPDRDGAALLRRAATVDPMTTLRSESSTP